jgi:hypothetical protein
MMFVGCEQVIDFDGDRPENKLVLNVVTGGDEQQHRIFLQRSAFMFSSDEIQPVNELPVEVRINGDLADIQAEGGGGIYEFTAGLHTGDKVEINVPYQSSTVRASDIVPEPPVIVSVDSVPFYDYNTGSILLRTLIKIKDKPGEKNYYRLLISLIRTYGEESELGTFTAREEIQYSVSQDIILSELSREGKENDNNLSRIFSDDLFSGAEYTLNVSFPLVAGSMLMKNKTEVEIELQSLTESLYLYMRSLEQKWNSDIFDQPVKVYSNVSGGYGILGLYNSCRRTMVFNKGEEPIFD